MLIAVYIILGLSIIGVFVAQIIEQRNKERRLREISKQVGDHIKKLKNLEIALITTIIEASTTNPNESQHRRQEEI